MKNLLIPIIAISTMMLSCKKADSVTPINTTSTTTVYVHDTLRTGSNYDVITFKLYSRNVPYTFTIRPHDGGSSDYTVLIKTNYADVNYILPNHDDFSMNTFRYFSAESIPMANDSISIGATYQGKSVKSIKTIKNANYTYNFAYIILPELK